jgi:hypothetical protein
LKRVYTAIIATVVIAAGLQQSQALTVDELGTGAAETVMVNITGIGKIPVEAGVLKLDVGGLQVDGFCIDPFHFSDGLMTGYQVVGLTRAPKGNFMSSGTALEIERLWGSYYSPTISATAAAGMQIAIWELIGGNSFSLSSPNDFGAAGFLAAVQDPAYDGPVADLVGLTGLGQDYGVASPSVEALTRVAPEGSSTASLLGMAVVTMLVGLRRVERLGALRARA